MSSSNKQYIYNPEVFDVSTISDAMNIILTPQQTSTEERWEKETKYLIDDMDKFFAPDENSFILDYGCGIGRLSKEIVERYNCFVVGVDISPSMRQLAKEYVNHKKFTTATREDLLVLIRQGFRFDSCLSLWVLQHCLNVLEDINLIKRSLKPEGRFYVLNNINSAVPTNQGWVNNGTDVFKLLLDHFNEIEHSRLPYSVSSKYISDWTYISRMINNKQPERKVFSLFNRSPIV